MVVHNVNTWVQEQKYVLADKVKDYGVLVEEGGEPLDRSYVLEDKRCLETAYDGLTKVTQSIPTQSTSEIEDTSFLLVQENPGCHSDQGEKMLDVPFPKMRTKTVKPQCSKFSQLPRSEVKSSAQVYRKKFSSFQSHACENNCRQYSWPLMKEILRDPKSSHSLRKTKSLFCLSSENGGLSCCSSKSQSARFMGEVMAANKLSSEEQANRSQTGFSISVEPIVGSAKTVGPLGPGMVYEGLGLGPHRLNEYGRPEVGFLALGLGEGDTIRSTIEHKVRPPFLS